MRLVSCELHVLAALTSENYSLYPLHRLLEGFKGRSEEFVGEINVFFQAGIEPTVFLTFDP